MRCSIIGSSALGAASFAQADAASAAARMKAENFMVSILSAVQLFQ
jgi:hypothetical protein